MFYKIEGSVVSYRFQISFPFENRFQNSSFSSAKSESLRESVVVDVALLLLLEDHQGLNDIIDSETVKLVRKKCLSIANLAFTHSFLLPKTLIMRAPHPKLFHILFE